MKIVSLNIWGGKMGQTLLDYICEQSKDTDVFCFQEVFKSGESKAVLPNGACADVFGRLSAVLPEFQSYFFKAAESYYQSDQKVDFELLGGQAIFVRKEYKILSSGSLHSHEDLNTPHISGFVSYVTFEKISIVNVHGIWTGGGKDDNPVRFKQAEIIIDLLKTLKGPKVVCGDFNLNPNTESLRNIGVGLRNLVSEFGITTTRSNLYSKKDKMPFADYTLVSPEVKVKNFQVPNIAVSDHLPMILEFE